jgi:hypothetical protein
MARPTVNIKIPRKPRMDENTRFYIDYEWWSESNMSLESFLQSQLGYEISLEDDGNSVDLIDSETGEVRQLSSFEFAIQNYFNNQKSAENPPSGSLVNNVFTTLLGNGNRPMTATQIAAAVKRPPETIFRTLGSGKVYLGIRPYTS